MKKILLKSIDPVGKNMSSGAIRYFEFARHLSNHFKIVLAIPNVLDFDLSGIETVTYYGDDLIIKNHLKDVDAILSPSLSHDLLKILKKINIHIIIDLFSSALPNKDDFEYIKSQITLGAHFLCANEEQKNYWIGFMSGQGKKISPEMIDIVPFGIPDAEPKHTQNCLKGVYKNIKTSDKVLLWNSHILPWHDPETVVAAICEITKTRDNIKLIFMTRDQKCEELSEKLGVLNKTVFFYDDIVDYHNRQNFLLESDIGILTHKDSMESKYSSKSKLLDNIWSFLPIITTVGGPMSSIVELEMIGLTCGFGDVMSVKNAIIKISDDLEFYQSCKLNLLRIAPNFSWNKVISPIIESIDKPAISTRIIEPSVQDNYKYDISVVIPTKDRSVILKKCLEHLILQDYPADKCEIIVVDDNSSDDTEEMTKNLKFPCGFKYLIQVPHKRGPAAANNLGIINAEGKYILFINNDILAKNDLLSQHMLFHQQHENIIVQGRAVNAISLDEPTLRPTGYTGYVDISLGYFTTWNCSAAKDVLIKAGLFDEDFKNISWEDVEFGFRLRKHGIMQKFNKNAIGYHYSPSFILSEKTMESIRTKSINMGYNGVMYYLKHPCFETKTSSQIWLPSMIIYFILRGAAKLLGKKRIYKILFNLENNNKQKLLAFLVGICGHYWYMRGVNEAWKKQSTYQSV